MIFTHRIGRKPLLPEMPPPFLAKIDMSRITTMRLSHCVTEAVGLRRNGNEMNVIGHETIRPNINFTTPAGIGHQGDIFSIIIVAEKGLHTAISPLCEMMRYTRYDDPRYPCHERNIADTFRRCQELSILSPEFQELSILSPEFHRSTSAPRSASIIVAYGPGSSVVKSRIFNPFNGPAISFFSKINQAARQCVFAGAHWRFFRAPCRRSEAPAKAIV